jgi:hypothetical protein
MSQPACYRVTMNRSPRRKQCTVPLALSWTHAGATYRITPWPDVRFERCYDQEWLAVSVLHEIAAAAASIEAAAWRSYLSFVPAEVRQFVAQFDRHPLAALQVAARCPFLLAELQETPALTAFVATHTVVRGLNGPRWDELNAVFERGGIFSVLEWLGLPASRQTLSILRNLYTADLPTRLLAPLRSTLWDPEALFALARLPLITESDLIESGHAMAA